MGIASKPAILFGNVMHARLFPKENKFRYGIYYLSLPLSQLNEMPIAYNRYALLSFYNHDHGKCDGSTLEPWARKILSDYGIDKASGSITLVCMPRVIGYVFNPVSFWLCHDSEDNLRAVICEVHNTFGERHCYLCALPDQRPINEKDVLKGDKVFHVSPFLEREGHYKFRFDTRNNGFSAWIDFYDVKGNKKLITSLICKSETMNKSSLSKAFWLYPLVTLKAIFLIHWQALKIITKGIQYIPKPLQKKEKITTTDKITKM